jgi:hypothetical protein
MVRTGSLTLITLIGVCAVQAQSVPDRGQLGWMEIRDDHYEADQWRWQYPSWAYAEVRDTDLEQEYDLRYSSNPFMLHGDFDGDGLTDVAAWVEQRADSAGGYPEVGVVVVHRSGGAHYFSAGGPNWEVYPQGEVTQGFEEGPPPALLGDALLFFKPEATSTIYYWDGESYEEYHQGD